MCETSTQLTSMQYAEMSVIAALGTTSVALACDLIICEQLQGKGVRNMEL